MHGVFSTNWIVFTGAPCSGKTSVLNYLREFGYSVTGEAARTLFSRNAEKGGTNFDLRRDENDFTAQIAMEQLRVEASLNPHGLHFLDRALPDTIAYFIVHEADSIPWMPLCSIFKYKIIFHFERLAFVGDEHRNESALLCEMLDTHCQQIYTQLGYNVIRVPRFLGETSYAIASRGQFVLSTINRYG